MALSTKKKTTNISHSNNNITNNNTTAVTTAAEVADEKDTMQASITPSQLSSNKHHSKRPTILRFHDGTVRFDY